MIMKIRLCWLKTTICSNKSKKGECSWQLLLEQMLQEAS